MVVPCLETLAAAPPASVALVSEDAAGSAMVGVLLDWHMRTPYFCGCPVTSTFVWVESGCVRAHWPID